MNDSAFFESGKQDDAPAANPIAEKLAIFTAQSPKRMLLYLFYNGLAHGWSTKNDMVEEYENLQDHWSNHMSLHKGLILAIPNVATSRCVLNTIWLHNGVAPSSLIFSRGGRKVENNRMLMEIMIGGKAYTAISVLTRYEVVPGLVIWASTKSLIIGTPVAIEQVNGVHSTISAYTNGNYVILEDPDVYKYII
ncbi:hypothetical protein BG015_001248 [Linnemannia schmuckeri]|uniref:Uncharacterized protein n=1 Tax=Linnemannia schmuckeri TaxID=64567 RepID=A0A9P5S416_9FUNG|nr:hypothetical protein BG015_001248 [Linnemannia schmuckeri]